LTNKEKKHNHFVPQVYLRNFAHTIEERGKKKNYFVSTYDKIEQTESQKTSIEKICVKSKLYTLKGNTKEDRERIENYYAGSFEKDYNRFYHIINDEEKIQISLDERALIIATVIHLYARNVFWLNAFNELWTRMVRSFESPNPRNVYDENGNLLFPFEAKSTEEIVNDEKKATQQTYLTNHLEMTRNLIKSHSFDSIFVYKDKSDNNLITSDRPVISPSVAGPFILPINKGTLLCIMPPKENTKYDLMTIARGNNEIFSDIMSHLSIDMMNSCQYENANRIIIGHDIEVLLQTMKNYQDFLMH